MTIAQNQTPTVEVVGEGIVYATPDMVNISISIEKEGLDLKNLRQKNGEAVAQVLQLLSKELPTPKDARPSTSASMACPRPS